MSLILNDVKHLLGMLLFLMVSAASSAFGANTHSESDVNELIGLLKQSGYVVYIRHAQTDHTQVDQIDLNIEEYQLRSSDQLCQTQRNLSKEGRETAKLIGRTFKALEIPVGKVYTSPFCRCVDTASLAFGEDYSVSEDLYFAVKASPKEKERLAIALRTMLSEQPSESSNTIIVSHTANLKEAANIWPKPEGVAYIFKPLGDGKFELKGKIAPNDWSQILVKH